MERQVSDQFERPRAQAATASLGTGDSQRAEHGDLRPIRYCDHVSRWRGELDRRRLLGPEHAAVRQRGRGTLGREEHERRRVRSRPYALRRPTERTARSRNRWDGTPGRRPSWCEEKREREQRADEPEQPDDQAFDRSGEGLDGVGDRIDGHESPPFGGCRATGLPTVKAIYPPGVSAGLFACIDWMSPST